MKKTTLNKQARLAREKEEGENAVLAKIAEMSKQDRSM
jgi:hypothetical protein